MSCGNRRPNLTCLSGQKVEEIRMLHSSNRKVSAESNYTFLVQNQISRYVFCCVPCICFISTSRVGVSFCFEEKNWSGRNLLCSSDWMGPCVKILFQKCWPMQNCKIIWQNSHSLLYVTSIFATFNFAFLSRRDCFHRGKKIHYLLGLRWITEPSY